MIKAVYAGTFDPITNGHLDMIKRALALFDEVHVVIFDNPVKATIFSIDERLAMIHEATKDLQHIIIAASDKLAVEYCEEVGAKVLVRGIRATNDYHYESMMAYSNKFLDENIEEVFLMTRLDYTFVSSSAIKEIASHHRDVSTLVPDCVNKALKEKYHS